jgi:EAL domain-containing protein (putative c-di-GMP-specific phosphodiesterase class I)
MENGLRRALEQDELVLHYQPQLSLADGQITGLEALVRWQHPQEGLLLPSTFMPVAEETHLVSELGKWVLRESCRQNRTLQLAGLLEVPIAVNLAAVQFQSKGFSHEVVSILQETGLPPRLLELELTEGVLMREVATALTTMQMLQEQGINIAVDDFGTGYSSLSYLARFPIHKLKIDKSFIRNIDKDNRRCAIVRAIIELGCGLNLQIVAEGVETREEMNRLRAEKCTAAQGYLLGRPMPVDALQRWLQEKMADRHAIEPERMAAV